MFGAIEAGGTKFRCMVGDGPTAIADEVRITTTAPQETLAEVIRFFTAQAIKHPIDAIGIGAFGPIDLDRNSATYGHITTTPKTGWQHQDLVGLVGDALKVPIGFDTDVAAAALGEYTWGAGQGIDNLVYLTVGTGIGGAALSAGRSLRGLVHAEMGHMLIPRVAGDSFAGSCPFHGDCFEGMASGPAIRKRWGQDPETLATDNPAWQLQASYLALGLANIILMLSPHRIVLGGGVMRAELFTALRCRLLDLLAGYVNSPEITDSLEDYVVPPSLGNQAGVLGALVLARRAYEQESQP